MSYDLFKGICSKFILAGAEERLFLDPEAWLGLASSVLTSDRVSILDDVPSSFLSGIVDELFGLSLDETFKDSFLPAAIAGKRRVDEPVTLMVTVVDVGGVLWLAELLLRFLLVNETQTSPIFSFSHGKPYWWKDRSGEQEDQPLPNTKKGCSRGVSTVT